MWQDAIDLRDFYASPIGAVARRTLRTHLRALWPDLNGMAAKAAAAPVLLTATNTTTPKPVAAPTPTPPSTNAPSKK